MGTGAEVLSDSRAALTKRNAKNGGVRTEKVGCFIYSGKPVSKYSRRKDDMDSRIAKYRLHHLFERDWLTYYLTRIALNLITR